VITDFIAQLGPWSWVIGGVLLLGLEIIAPGTFFLWFGIAAIIVGVASLVFDWAWQIEVAIFAVLAIILVVIGRRYFAGWGGNAPAEGLVNDRASRLVGSVYVLSEPIVDGLGRVRIDDTTWRVAGPDLPSGQRVRVTGFDGTILRVEPFS
jgi:membrane protein implicated in regulation of membrane protease activity